MHKSEIFIGTFEIPCGDNSWLDFYLPGDAFFFSKSALPGGLPLFLQFSRLSQLQLVLLPLQLGPTHVELITLFDLFWRAFPVNYGLANRFRPRGRGSVRPKQRIALVQKIVRRRQTGLKHNVKFDNFKKLVLLTEFEQSAFSTCQIK